MTATCTCRRYCIIEHDGLTVCHSFHTLSQRHRHWVGCTEYTQQLVKERVNGTTPLSRLSECYCRNQKVMLFSIPHPNYSHSLLSQESKVFCAGEPTACDSTWCCSLNLVHHSFSMSCRGQCRTGVYPQNKVIAKTSPRTSPICINSAKWCHTYATL